jgi:hypothetical protein
MLRNLSCLKLSFFLCRFENMAARFSVLMGGSSTIALSFLMLCFDNYLLLAFWSWSLDGDSTLICSGDGSFPVILH